MATARREWERLIVLSRVGLASVAPVLCTVYLGVHSTAELSLLGQVHTTISRAAGQRRCIIDRVNFIR